MLPSLIEVLSIFYEELSQHNSKLPVPKKQKLTVTAGSHVANDIEQDVFDMIEKSYASLGGHAKIKKPSDVGTQYPYWNVADTDEDPEPDVAELSSSSPTSHGKKLGAVATDGSAEAKNALMDMLRHFFSTPGNWAEVSGAMANILIKKLGIKPVEDVEKVKSLLGGKEIVWNGSENPEGNSLNVNGWYTRVIGSEPHTKIIVGSV